jgi:hypothetical protein
MMNEPTSTWPPTEALNGTVLAALNTTPAGEAAAFYAEQLGWPVVPIAGMVGEHCGCRRRAACEHPAKHPLTPGGIKAASADPDQVREWWAHWPWAGVGLLTGSHSGLVVVDVDPAHGGRESLAALRGSEAELPRTLYARTGGGGWHLFYAHPGHHVANSTGRLGARMLPGIDLRADGGYVVAAPSGHRSGGRYTWAAGPETLAAMPTWVAQRSDATQVPMPARPARADRLAAYAAAALEGECRRVATAPEGLRSDTLNRAAFSLGTLVGAGVLDESLVVDSLAAAAAAASRSGERPLGSREAMATIRSGLARGIERPRALHPAPSTPHLVRTAAPPPGGPACHHTTGHGPRL